MQLVAYGAQDIYLTGNPQITFFKVVYRRHTNFSMEAIEQTINGTVGFGKTFSSTISRNGDLVSNMYMDLTLMKKTGTGQYYPGEDVIDTVELEIGGQLIDRHYADWFRIYDELNRHGTEKEAYRKLTNFKGQNIYNANFSAETEVLTLPLLFWFNRNPGLALPLIALQYHEVKVKVTTKSSVTDTNTAVVEEGAAGEAMKLWCDYIYLDTDERRRFAQVSHEYLIEQVQRESNTISASTTNNVSLNFNHPVKYLAWVAKNATNIHGKYASVANKYQIGDIGAEEGEGSSPDYYFTNLVKSYYTTDGLINGAAKDGIVGGIKTCQLKLNGHDRFAERNGLYFNLVQPFQSFGTSPMPGIFSYSFALKPTEHQPSGTCNFSRIDNAQLTIVTDATLGTELEVYAVNYNVLRIMSGMGGLAYSN